MTRGNKCLLQAKLFCYCDSTLLRRTFDDADACHSIIPLTAPLRFAVREEQAAPSGADLNGCTKLGCQRLDANVTGNLTAAVTLADRRHDFRQEFVDLLCAAAGELGRIDGGVEVDAGERFVAFAAGR